MLNFVINCKVGLGLGLGLMLRLSLGLGLGLGLGWWLTLLYRLFSSRENIHRHPLGTISVASHANIHGQKRNINT